MWLSFQVIIYIDSQYF